MKKSIVIAGIALGLFIFVSSYAQENQAVPNNNKPVPEKIKQDARQNKNAKAAEVKVKDAHKATENEAAKVKKEEAKAHEANKALRADVKNKSQKGKAAPGKALKKMDQAANSDKIIPGRKSPTGQPVYLNQKGEQYYIGPDGGKVVLNKKE